MVFENQELVAFAFLGLKLQINVATDISSEGDVSM
jgi:hypothetical protein